MLLILQQQLHKIVMKLKKTRKEFQKLNHF